MARNIREVLDKADQYLAKHEVDSSRLDAEVLLADLMDTERIKLYVNYDYPLTEEQLSAFRERLKERAQGVPVSYIIGYTEFMSLEFIIDRGVLIPRPETEELVEKVLQFCRENDWQQPRIVDLGTGSGAIMVSLAHYLPEAKVIGTDISAHSVKTARKNIKAHELSGRAAVLSGSWAEPLLPDKENEVDLVVSNPPYISEEDMKDLPRNVKKEPERALAGGKDGLKCYKELIPQAGKLLKDDGLLALEIGCEQGEELEPIFTENQNWSEAEVKQDNCGRNRFIFARYKQKSREARGEGDGN